MNKTLLLNKTLITFGTLAGLFGILALLMTSSLLPHSSAVSFALTVDLLVTVPFIYFCLIYKTAIPKTTVIPVIAIGLLIGSYLLPKDSQAYLALFKTWALPVIELAVLTFVIIKVLKAIKTYRKHEGATPDFYDALKSTCYQVLPKRLVLPFAMEIAIFYYGFINWKKTENSTDTFTYHKKSGAPSLLGGLILVIAVETFALHFLLSEWSPVTAWIFTGLSIYTSIQVLGLARSLSKRPISFGDENLKLRYGIWSECQIEYSTIASIDISKNGLGKDKMSRTLSPLGELEGYNVIIHLKRENTLIGLYGIKKKFKVIGLHIDEPDKFKKKLDNVLQP